MADKSFFGRLQKLFSTNAVVRRVGTNRLKVIAFIYILYLIEIS